MYDSLKLAHILLAVSSITGFVVRAAWSYAGSPRLRHKAVRILPHVIDTVFLLSAVGMVLAASVPVMQTDWLLAKIAGLVAYVLVGSIAIRRGRTAERRLVAAVCAVAIFTWIVGVAVTKSPIGWLQPWLG